MSAQKWLTTSAGVAMPPIIYGTAWKKERTADLVLQAVQTGFRGIDTAGQPKHYDEPGVGEALGRLNALGIARGAVFVQTKFTPLSGQDPGNVPYDKNASIEEQVDQSFRSSKKNLHTDYVDSLLLHSPLTPYSLLMKAWRAMERIQKAGDARQIGICNCYDIELLETLHADAEVKPSVVQNRFYQQTGYDADLRRWSARHGMIYQSFWTLTANPHILAADSVRSMALTYDKTEAQVLFRYLTQSGVVPLTGTRSEQHMREDLEIFDFELSSQDLEAVSFLLNSA